ncbi:Cytochrome P450, partial [Penicillium angulare]
IIIKFSILLPFHLKSFDMITLIAGILLFLVGRTVYRLFFHPLCKFPGPKLAAASSMYEFYFSVLKGGMFIREMEKIHEKYGPIVRISPNELHISDPDYYGELFGGTRDKVPIAALAAFLPTSMVVTVGHNLHAARRRPVANYFSKMAVQNLDSVLQSKIDKLCSRMQEVITTEAVFPLGAAFAALTADVISECSYGFSVNYLDDPDFKNDIQQGVSNLASIIHIPRWVPFSTTVFSSIPEGLLSRVHPALEATFRLKGLVRTCSQAALENKEVRRECDKTVFDALIDPSVPPVERSLNRLVDEGMIILMAGVETTASTLSLIIFNLLYTPDMLSKLRNELDMHPGHTSWSELERLPYMRGVINEGLRIFMSYSQRLLRSDPTENTKYKDWIIPAGTAVSQSVHFLHTNTEIFPDPYRFDPERWIRAQEQGDRLETCLAPFSKGTRQCLGMHLAYAEIYLGLAAIVRRFDLKIYKTTVEDMTHYREYAFGHPKKRNAGLRVTVTGNR